MCSWEAWDNFQPMSVPDCYKATNQSTVIKNILRVVL